MEIHIIRHTKVVIPDSICFGQTDCALRPEWKDDMKAIALDNDYDAVYSSPLLRCTQLAAYFGLHYIKEERLRELTFGDWEMQAWDDIPKEEIAPWYADFINVTPPNGENLLTLQARNIDFIKDIEIKHANDKILIITHSGVIRILLQYVLDFPLENMFRLQPQHGKKMILTKEFGLWKCIGMNW
jgi:alpha-ribazole phosphatase